jgi:hypothetical protein
MTTQSPRIWYKAKLLPAAQSIFTEGFYPEAKQRTGSQYVYFTQAQASSTNQKVLIASRLAENSFRMLTLELARHCLEPQEKATRLEIEQLNSLSQHLEKNV